MVGLGRSRDRKGPGFTEGSSFDTLLAIYAGFSISNLSIIATNDDAAPENGLLTSEVQFDAVAGQAYQVAVDGFDGDSGQIRLLIAPVEPRLTEPSLKDGVFRFNLLGVPGKTNAVEASPDLLTWEGLGEVVNTTGFTPLRTSRPLIIQTDSTGRGLDPPREAGPPSATQLLSPRRRYLSDDGDHARPRAIARGVTGYRLEGMRPCFELAGVPRERRHCQRTVGELFAVHQ